MREDTGRVSPGTELSVAPIVVCRSLNAFLMEFSEGEHHQPIVCCAQHRGSRSICSMERGRKLKTGIVEVREEFDEMMVLSVLRRNC